MDESYLEQLDVNLLKQNISNFWDIDFEKAARGELQKAYLKCFLTGTMKEYPINFYSILVEGGTKLYRVRGDITYYTDIKQMQDFSYNPEPKLNRFNNELEKTLYVSTNYDVPIKEIGITPGRKFLLLEYEVTKKMLVRAVNISNWYQSESSENKEKIDILNSFINGVMAVSTDEKSSAYKITTLLKDYPPFSLSDREIGWFYQSIRGQGVNLALRYPKANGFLKLYDFNILEMGKDKGFFAAENKGIADWKKEILDYGIII